METAKNKENSRRHFVFKPIKTDTNKLVPVVGLKVSKLSTKRNKLKRHIREVVRGLKNRRSGRIIALPGSETLSFKEIRSEIEQIT